MRHSIDLISWLLLLTLAALWSTSFLFNEVALEELDPFTIVLGRVATGAVAIWLYVLVRGIRIPTGFRIWAGFALIGLLNNVLPFSLIVWGQSHILGGEAAILHATTPIFAVVIGHFVTQDDRLTRNRAIGILLGILGAAVMVGVETADLGARVSWGYLAVIGASVAYACAVHSTRRVTVGIPGPVAAAGMLSMSTLWMIPVAVLLGDPLPVSVRPSTLGAVLLLGVFGSAIAYIVYFAILKRAGPTNLTLVAMMIPPSALILGAVFLDERFGANDFAGLALIVAALAIIDGRILHLYPGRRNAKPPARS